MSQKEKQDLEAKRKHENAEFHAQIKKHTRHQIIGIVIVILVIICGMGLYSHHQSVTNYRNRISRAKRMNKSIDIERKSPKKMTFNSKKFDNTSKSNKKSNGQSKINAREFTQFTNKLSSVYAQHKVPMKVSYDKNGGQIVYILQGKLADAYLMPSLVENNNAKQMGVSKSLYKMYSKNANKYHQQVVTEIRGIQNNIKSQSKNHVLPYEIKVAKND